MGVCGEVDGAVGGIEGAGVVVGWEVWIGFLVFEEGSGAVLFELVWGGGLV